MLKLFIPAIIIFVAFVVAISLSVILRKRQHRPSCQAAGELMGHKCECGHAENVVKQPEHNCCGKHH